jgi:ribosomal protein S6 kinase beta
MPSMGTKEAPWGLSVVQVPDLVPTTEFHSSEEQDIDFADVFGVLSTPLDGDGSPLPLMKSAGVADGEEQPRWEQFCQPSPIKVGPRMIGSPSVLYSRGHSFVGPDPLEPSPLARSLTWSRGATVEKTLSSLGESFLSIGGPDTVDEKVAYAAGTQTLPNAVEAAGSEALGAASGGDDVLSIGGCSSGDEGPGSGSEGSAQDVTPQTKRRSKKKLQAYGPNDFELLRVVGQGAFGKVFQVRKKDTGDILAMKVMVKNKIVERNQGDYMKAERDILTKVVHPFIVQLRYSFQTSSKLYLLLDYINGGHLFYQLLRQGIFSEDLGRLYSAEIVSAVSHLHSRGIIHRDLKPENILLDHEGHVKLTDFGLAKEITDTCSTNSLCGTMEYMAPEILTGAGHGKAADWWSVGILLYEMLTGSPPFVHNNRQKLQQKILTDKPKLPKYLTSEAVTLLKGLLNKDPKRRLGGNSDDIKNHKFFKGINWRKLENREIKPNFCPTVNGKDCAANFDEMWTKLPPQDSPAATPKSDVQDIDNLFMGYSYVSPSILEQLDLDSDDDDDGVEGSTG